MRWKYVDVNAEKFHFGGAGAAAADLGETTHQYNLINIQINFPSQLFRYLKLTYVIWKPPALPLWHELYSIAHDGDFNVFKAKHIYHLCISETLYRLLLLTMTTGKTFDDCIDNVMKDKTF